jgi:acyl dehydratase
MSEIHFKDQHTLATLVSADFGNWSNPVTVDQNMIDQYAELSGDHMWLHVDVERCARESPFGGTIAHGFLTLSLLPKMAGGPNPLENITGFSHVLNYGSDKLRFVGVVPVDSAIASRSRIKAVEVSEKKTKIILETHVHVVGADSPCLVYELMMVYL